MNKRYLRLSWRYLSSYPKRTLAMVLSICLCVFFVVTMGSLAQSARTAEVINVQKNAGQQHVIFRELNAKQVRQLVADQDIKSSSRLVYYGGWQAPSGLLVNLLAADENILNLQATGLLKGSFPAGNHEIALESWVLDRLGLPQEIGQKIEVALQETGQTETYTLRGIIKDRMANKSTGNLEGYVAFTPNNLSGRDTHINLLLEYQAGADFAGKIAAAKAEYKLTKEQVMPNKMLLSAMGELEVIDWKLVEMAFILMLVGGMVIYSVYNISSLRRIQEYGTLRAIGTSRKQLLAIMLGEIGIIYLVGTTAGMVLSVLFVHLFKGAAIGLFVAESIGNNQIDVIVIPARVLLLSIFIALGSVLAAALKSAYTAMQLSPMEAIRVNSAEKAHGKVRKSSCLEYRFDLPRRLAIKNLRRNRKALVLTAATMAVGCTIFLVNSFQNELFEREHEAYRQMYAAKSYEFNINVNNSESMKNGFTAAQLQELEDMSQVEKVLGRSMLYSRIKVPTTQLNGEYGRNYLREKEKRQAQMDQRTEDVDGVLRFSFMSPDKKSVIMQNTMLGLPDEELRALDKNLIAGDIDLEQMKKQSQAVIFIPKVNRDGSFYDEKGEQNKKPVLNIKVGDKIQLTYPKTGYEQGIDNYKLLLGYEANQKYYTDAQFTVGAIIDELPAKDNFHLGSDTAPYLLVPNTTLQSLIGYNNYRLVAIDMQDTASEADYQALKTKVQELADTIPGTDMMDQRAQQQSSEQFGKQYWLLQNAIVAILIFISALSIYNNVNYALISRRRQHGILRAIGLTPRQFKRMLRFEGLSYGLIATAFSFLIAFIIQTGIYIYWTYLCPYPFYYQGGFFWHWQPYMLILALNLFVGYLATLGPTRQVNKMGITEAIRTVE